MTVGSTSFDALTLVALSESFLRHLQAHGYTGISIQHGRSGQPLPQTPHMDDFDIEVFDYAPSLASEMRSADLIISHAGTSRKTRKEFFFFFFCPFTAVNSVLIVFSYRRRKYSRITQVGQTFNCRRE